MSAFRLSVLCVLFAACVTAWAHERPVVKVAAVIQSDTISKRLELDPKKRKAAVAEARKRIAESIATRLNDVFSVVRWTPEHMTDGMSIVGHLVVTIEEQAQPYGLSTYVLRYEPLLDIPMPKSSRPPIDYGAGEPLFDPGRNSPPLGDALKLGIHIANKVAEQLCSKRGLVMTNFFSLIPLCPAKPSPGKDHAFVLHLPFDEINATEESVFKVAFATKSKAKPDGETGSLLLTPLRRYDAQSAPRAMFNCLDFTGGFSKPRDCKEWTDEIYPLFDEAQRYASSIVYVKWYRSTADTSKDTSTNDIFSGIGK
jgi:hypothetical protein